jgi:hypothetical protein
MGPGRQRLVQWATALAIAWPAAGWSAAVPGGYRAVAAETGVPDTVLYAVALAESGVGTDADGVRRPWPWTLNVAGRAHVYPTRAAAYHALDAFFARGERSIDIGLMQVSWRFHRAKLGDAWEALDPYHNLRVGARILRACFEQRGDWWAGVGCYHAPADPERAQRYRARVAGHWRRLVSRG